MTEEEIQHYQTLSDDDLYNVLQQARIDLYCAECETSDVKFKLIDELNSKVEAIYQILDGRGLNAHRQF